MNSLSTVARSLLVSVIWMGLWDGTLGAGCSADEREALLKFKADLEDPSSWLTSWVGQEDCCTWSHVVCDNYTGHVTELHLGLPQPSNWSNSVLSGKLNPSLLELKYLGYLDLSNSDFHGIQVPSFLGLMTSLNTLYLDEAGFGGLIPHQLGNLSNLQHLGLQASKHYGLYADSLRWLSGLPSLKFLDLSNVDLSNASDWLNMINALPSLSKLYLANCQILHTPALANVNLSSLSSLSLYHNQFDQTSVPSWVFHLKSLTFLNLAYNTFRGPIPLQLQNLTSLRTLELASNHFNHSVPNWLYSLHHLEYLDLYSNKLNGRVSTIGIGNLSSLVHLDMSVNHGLEFERGIPESFKSLCRLRSLSLGYVKLNQNVSEVLEILGECASNTLQELYLDTCQLHGQLTDQIGLFKRLNRLILPNNSISGPLPSSFGEMTSLNHLDLSRNKINGSFPTSFGSLTGLAYVDISRNAMHGVVLPEIHFANLTKLTFFLASGNQMAFKANPDWVPSRLLQILNLVSWYVGPGFPHWLKGLQYLKSLDLANSGISEPIPDWFWSMSSQFYYMNFSHNQISGRLANIISVVGTDSLFDFSNNHLEGPLPMISSNLTLLDLSYNLLSGNLVKFLCFHPSEMRTTQYLNLCGNLLSGEIPGCWKNWRSLEVLRLGSNKFIGRIPNSIGTLTSLVSLHIQNNSLTGEIPLSLGNCSKLLTIDLGYNGLEGEIPRWMGVSLSRLSILNLRANKFHGSMPVELCHLQFLQILDLSHNSLSGSLPECLSNFIAMATSDNTDVAVIYLFFGGGEVYSENQILLTKGSFVDYSTILNYVRSVDLSCNNLSGVIPEEITDLKELQYLNLSHNLFSCRMPEGLQTMESLESMDLSVNRLTGVIPPGIASLTFLSYLNLSYNNLSGEIPSSTQLQSFDSWSFIGNQDLCGLPLNKGCSASIAVPSSGNDDEEDEFLWFSISTSIGFVTGFAVTELDVDNYNDDDDEESELCSSGSGDVYYPSNDQDPYLKGVDVYKKSTGISLGVPVLTSNLTAGMLLLNNDTYTPRFSWSIAADVESLAWDPHNSHFIFFSI
ncbi:unnamed protein product [Linum trigynum]|uniref:Leucine-rich repeat-containing N-terminal plant-type domain-containing protein n=1 Tax=Linum trigynum TaxID=586398 RepID=A0AAV2CP51_9ROSI